MKKILSSAAAVMILFSACTSNSEPQLPQIVISGYGPAMYAAEFTPEGQIVVTDTIEAVDASFIVKGENGNIYATSESRVPGAYTFSKDLELLSYWTDSVGGSPCNIIRPTGTDLILLSSYNSGEIDALSLDAEDHISGMSAVLRFEGEGPVPRQQAHSRVHQVYELAPGIMLSNDLGTDQIHIVRIDDELGLVHLGDFAVAPGSGPRHMTIDKEKSLIYLVTEISRDVLVIKYSLDGDVPSLELVQSLEADQSQVSGGADIHISPNGKFLYASMRNDLDGIVSYRILEDGTLEAAGYTATARHPRYFNFSPDGKYMLVCCVNDACVQIFEVGEDGSLTKTSEDFSIEGLRPTCFVFR